MAKAKGNYSEATGKNVIAAYNAAIDSIMASKDPTKVLSEIGKVAVIGLGGVQNDDYLGRLIADKSIEGMLRAVEIYKLDRNAGLEALTEASKKVHSKLVNTYVAGFVTQEGIKPELSREQELGEAVNRIYGEWIRPVEESQEDIRSANLRRRAA